MSRLLSESILELKKKRKAIILAHNYQLPEIQDIADYVGDSLGLSQTAAGTNADVVVFCGVHFMAETASILCPDKVVLIPDLNAGCPMADMIDSASLTHLKEKHENALVVSYVNSTAEVKAKSDFCCTSANAAQIIGSIDSSKEIIFVPDKYLGHYAAKRLYRKIILWEGYCPTHVRILPEHIKQAKQLHPNAKVMVHPECRPDVIELADIVLSTSGMCEYSKKSSAAKFIVGTETGLIHRLRKEFPDRQFIPATEFAVCPNMKLNTLEKVVWALEELKYEVRVPNHVRVKAREAVENMLVIGRQE